MRILSLLFVATWFITAAAAQAQARYSHSAAGNEVTDSQTGLIWRRCSEGMAWNGSTCTGTATTYSHESALAYAKTQTGWRIPNIKELLSIVDLGRMNPAIDTTAFPATIPGWYWSSSPFVQDPSFAWIVNFDHGEAYGGSRSGVINRGGTKSYFVTLRLVR